MGPFAARGVELRHLFRGAAFLADSRRSAPSHRSRSRCNPSRLQAPPRGCPDSEGQLQRRPAGDGDLVENRVAEVADPVAVRGEERRASSLGVREQSRLERVDRAEKKIGDRVRIQHDERLRAPVGGNGDLHVLDRRDGQPVRDGERPLGVASVRRFRTVQHPPRRDAGDRDERNDRSEPTESGGCRGCRRAASPARLRRDRARCAPRRCREGGASRRARGTAR